MTNKDLSLGRETSAIGVGRVPVKQQYCWQWKIARAFFLVAVAVAAAASVATLMGISSPFFLYLDQPRVHYFTGLVLLAIIALRCRWWRSGFAIGFFVAVNLHFLSPVAMAQVWQPSESAVSFGVLHANLGAQKEVASELVEFVDNWQPDLLSFQEVTPEFAAALPVTFPQYALLDSEPRPDTRGIALLVNKNVSDELQVESTDITRNPVAGDRPFAEAVVSRSDVRLRLLGFHCVRPDNANQAAEYEELAAWFRRSPTAYSLAFGDFNATPWSQTVRRFLARAEIPAVQTGFSFAPTWPAGPIGRLGVPIDLTAHSAGLQVETHVGPYINSDHYPFYSRVIVKSTDNA